MKYRREFLLANPEMNNSNIRLRLIAYTTQLGRSAVIRIHPLEILSSSQKFSSKPDFSYNHSNHILRALVHYLLENYFICYIFRKVVSKLSVFLFNVYVMSNWPMECNILCEIQIY